MSHPSVARRALRVVTLAAASALVACGSGSAPSSTGTSQHPGVYAEYFDVTVRPPTGGSVTSADGRIVCGTAGTSCAARYAWTARVVLTATPDPGYTFGTWAGDCELGGECVLDTSVYRADKYVVAVFGLGGEVQHGNFTSPAVHGPAFLDRLAGLPNTLDCSSARCHGPTYDGVGIALSCNACHAAQGWTSWRTNCTFCHGRRVLSGDVLAADPSSVAPPDAVSERLTGAPAPARSGAHRQHLTGTTAAGAAWSAPLPCAVCHVVPSDLSHVRGSAARAAVALSGASRPSLPASLGVYDEAAGTCSTYCHGDGRAPGLSPEFATTAALACDGCHGVPPGSGHPYRGADLTRCARCHPQTMSGAGTILAGGGGHVDGVVQGTAVCDGCHGFPPQTGAHVKHFGLSGSSTSAYGDTRALQDMFPGASPVTAPATYAFGCGACHPLDFSSHESGVADVVLHEPAAPAGSLKARAAPGAAYDRAAGTCSGVYCHSSGQESPAYRTTPPWTSSVPLACDACHDNPPRYPSGGAGSGSANGHLGVDGWGWVVGHFGGVGGVGHADRHGAAGASETAITCQTCHFETTDPASTGASGFYWLDTTGDYEFAGTDPAQAPVACAGCHGGTGGPSTGAGRVLPLRHVNGVRDVAFDPRTVIAPTIPYLPPAPDTPERPYYRTGNTTADWLGAVQNGSTRSYHLGGATYDAATKTCSVACHNLTAAPDLRTVWGAGFDWNCSLCHPH